MDKPFWIISWKLITAVLSCDWLITKLPLCRVTSLEGAAVDNQSRVNIVRGVETDLTCADVGWSDLRSAGTTGRRERPAAGQRSGSGRESASWRPREKQTLSVCNITLAVLHIIYTRTHKHRSEDVKVIIGGV